MFGHDKHDDDDDEVVQPSTQPANEALLGVNDSVGADNATADDNSATADPDNEATDDTQDDPTDIGVKSGSEVPPLDENEDETVESVPVVTKGDSANSNDLLDIKREALQQLSPLVGHLDQTPEEKFKTTMMMIQATDDKSLIGEAFAAAKEISDDKARAQALLDIINEINYFTQPAKD